jgi:acetylornithine deacetylase/succinyl-diaminopimelate desuccinylase-like protein
MNPYEYVEAHREEFLDDLITLVRIPSVSAVSEFRGDIQRAAEWYKAHFDALGMNRTEIFETPGHPIVYAEWLGAGNAPTVLVYGHYDVQPADDPFGQWKSDPFDPVVRDGSLYARGASDDKGQTVVHLKAIESLMAAGKMPVNIKVVIEGEEERGSDNFYPFLDRHADLLQADVVVISDTSILGTEHPSIVYALRGIVAMEIEVKGPKQDLHSGMYGGGVHNPAKALVDILAAMHDRDHRITVPGFYDSVRYVDEAERAELAKTPFPLDRLEKETGVKKAWGEPDYALHERLGIRPTFEINGLVSGWTGEGGKTIVPARALAKITCRLVPDQDPVKIYELVREYVKAITPDTVTSEVRMMHKGNPVIVDRDSPYMRAAFRAYEFGFGVRPVFMREGGSIPVVGAFQNVLNAPVILMGFGLPDDNAHGPNEKFSLDCFYRGIKTIIKFYEDIGV